MQLVVRIAKPPAKPLMIYDGDCGFCRRWVARFQRWTASHIDYLAAQDQCVAEQFPELLPTQLDTAVHLVATDGSVYFGAEAVFRSLAFASRARWLLRWYEGSTAFARVSEGSYRFIARHRKFFSAIS